MIYSVPKVIFLFERLITLFDKTKNRKNIALFLDGPNLLRKEFEIDLNQLMHKMEECGSLREAKIYLNQFAPDKLVEAVANLGFEPVIGIGEKKDDIASDVDVYVATGAVSAIYNKNIDIIALGTRDADFLPVIQLAKRLGKEVIIIGVDAGFSRSLQHAADKVITLDTKDKQRNGRKKSHKA